MCWAWRWLTELKHVAGDKWLIKLCLDLFYRVLLILLSYLLLSPPFSLLSCFPVVSPSPSPHSHSSTLSTPTALHAAWSGFENRYGQQILLFSQNIQTCSTATHLPIEQVPGFFPAVKRTRYKVNSSPLSNTEVKNEWSCASTPTIHLHGVDGDTF